MELLRFTTAGSVDNGEGLLIERLLYNSKLIFENQLTAVKQSGEVKGFQQVDLPRLTSSRRSERQQGITIDAIIPYRYFTIIEHEFTTTRPSIFDDTFIAKKN
jgi:sulfate adenylyltransferase subunit 1